MGTTPYLGLPELSQSQANPDVTVNEAVAVLGLIIAVAWLTADLLG